MSKSENQNATLYLKDSDEEIRKKVSKIKTETAGGAATMPESVANLFLLLRLVAGSDVVGTFEADYEAGTIRFGDMKEELAKGMIAFIAPIREKAEAIRNDEPYLRRIMEQGADKARTSAQDTLKRVREVMGLKYY